MTKRKETDGQDHRPTITLGVRPGDFPVGSVQSRAAARALVSGTADERNRNAIADLGQLSEIEQALVEDERLDPLAQSLVIRLYRAAREREEIYAMPLPPLTPEGIRHTDAVDKEIDAMTGGQSYFLKAYNKQEWNRLRAIAELNLSKNEE